MEAIGGWLNISSMSEWTPHSVGGKQTPRILHEDFEAIGEENFPTW
jgi:hypothetical protein